MRAVRAVAAGGRQAGPSGLLGLSLQGRRGTPGNSLFLGCGTRHAGQTVLRREPRRELAAGGGRDPGGSESLEGRLGWRDEGRFWTRPYKSS